MFKLFSRRDREDRSIVHSTEDSWEAEVVRSALLSESIPATVKSIKGEDRKSHQNIVLVPTSKVREAEMVIRRASIVISKKEDILAEQEERERLASPAVAEEYEVFEEPAAAEEEIMVTKHSTKVRAMSRYRAEPNRKYFDFILFPNLLNISYYKL